MTFTGSGGAEIIQLNPVESDVEGTAFLKYPVVLEQQPITLLFLSIVLIYHFVRNQVSWFLFSLQ